jgi:hypothetical protein
MYICITGNINIQKILYASALQVKKFVTLVTGTKLTIGSAGFFTVNRRNVTSVSQMTLQKHPCHANL